MIHEDDIIGFFKCHLKSLCSATCRIHADFCISEKFSDHKKIRFVIIDNKHLRLGSLEAGPVLPGYVCPVLFLQIDITYSGMISDRLGYLNDKRGALGIYAVDRNRTSHELR